MGLQPVITAAAAAGDPEIGIEIELAALPLPPGGAGEGR